MSLFHKKHYQEIAKLISNMIIDEEWNDLRKATILEDFIWMFKKDNPNFNEKQFKEYYQTGGEIRWGT